MENHEGQSLSLRCAKSREKGDSLFSTTKEIRGWSIWNLSGIYLPWGQNLRRYIAAQFLTRPANAKNPANLTACGVSWSWQCDSNTRPADYESAALPTELCQHLSDDLIIISKHGQLVKGLQREYCDIFWKVFCCEYSSQNRSELPRFH